MFSSLITIVSQYHHSLKQSVLGIFYGQMFGGHPNVLKSLFSFFVEKCIDWKLKTIS
jgi:hypothetical protein